MHADSFHRLMKLLVDSGECRTIEEAVATFSGYGVRLVLADSVANRKTRRGADVLRPYRCGSCRKWHLGHQKRKTARETPTGMEGTLVICTEWMLQIDLFPRVIAEFRQKFPRVEIELREEPIHKHMKLVRSG